MKLQAPCRWRPDALSCGVFCPATPPLSFTAGPAGRIAAGICLGACAALQETQVRLENWLGRYAEPDFLQWAVTLRESGTLAGVVNLHGVDEAHCCAETSYALSPAYRAPG